MFQVIFLVFMKYLVLILILMKGRYPCSRMQYFLLFFGGEVRFKACFIKEGFFVY